MEWYTKLVANRKRYIILLRLSSFSCHSSLLFSLHFYFSFDFLYLFSFPYLFPFYPIYVYSPFLNLLLSLLLWSFLLFVSSAPSFFLSFFLSFLNSFFLVFFLFLFLPSFLPSFFPFLSFYHFLFPFISFSLFLSLPSFYFIHCFPFLPFLPFPSSLSSSLPFFLSYLSFKVAPLMSWMWTKVVISLFCG